MNKRCNGSNRLRSAAALLLTCALTLSVGERADADDTEVYLGQPTTAASGRPNILFVIDTSGSMGGQVTTQEAYNPAETYTGNCPANRIYWKSASSGITNVPARADCSLRGDDESDTGWIDASNFLCQTARAVIDVNGFQPVSRSAQWRPRNPTRDSKWTTLRQTRNQFVECADDSDATKITPAHGNGTLPYAGNGTNGPYTSEAAQQISWNTSDTQASYTFYSSNYLNWYHNARTTTTTRLQIVKDVVRNTLNSISDVNVGIMRFSTDGQGGYVLHEIADLATARASILTQVDALSPSGNTPLSETLYEAALYWTGGIWDYGNRSSPARSIRASRTAAEETRYLAPIASSCQKNFIVYLTDGEPVSDTDAQSKILALPNFNTRVGTSCTANTGSGANNNNGRCLDDLAEYLFESDLSPEPGLQNAITYTVGFGADVQSIGWATDLLRETARRGGGTFYEASDTATLTSVFTSIVQEILAVNTTFTAPTVSVNAFNRTQNLNDLFITMFGTSNRYHWPGNIKKYEVLTDGTVVGQGNVPAVDAATGFFRPSVRSFWSSVVDGADVNLGGVASRLPTPATRNLFTDVAGGSLSGAGNGVLSANTAISNDMVGLDAAADQATRDKLFDWIRGADVDATAAADRLRSRREMGDPLHARPATVIYGGTADNPDMVLYATTNDGFLHAIDPATGDELWSYIPSHLLRRMNDLYANEPQPAKRYGLDGSLRVMKTDANGNGLVDGTDRVYLYFGMGRGGQSYFALDVTDKNAPELLWRIGSPTEVTATGAALATAHQLPGLAQTWSTPVPTRVRIGTQTRSVLIFGGGYDPTQDNVAGNTDDTGNRLYFVDAVTGELLWRAGPSTGFGYDSGANFMHPQLTHSIPADVRVIDLNSDGLADRMYAADMGGRVWRFDIHHGNPANTLVTGGVFASLGHADGTGSPPTDSRRFYYPPDVSMIRDAGRTYFNLAIGSGYRGSPLNRQIHDRFYSLRDYEPFVAKTQTQYDSFTVITDTDTRLVDVTNTINPTIPTSAVGWKINLETSLGEKVLAEARTFQGRILFTTYLPNAGTTVPGSNVCVARQGANRLYTVNAINGAPVVNRDGSTGPDGSTTNPDETEDRWDDLGQGGIAPEPVILFPETSVPTCLVGVEQCGVTFTNDPIRTFWNRWDTDSGD